MPGIWTTRRWIAGAALLFGAFAARADLATVVDNLVASLGRIGRYEADAEVFRYSS